MSFLIPTEAGQVTWDMGVRASGLGGLGFRVSGSGFRVSDFCLDLLEVVVLVGFTRFGVQMLDVMRMYAEAGSIFMIRLQFRVWLCNFQVFEPVQSKQERQSAQRIIRQSQLYHPES